MQNLCVSAPMKFLLHTKTFYQNYNYVNRRITNYINFIYHHHHNYKTIKFYSQFKFHSFNYQNDFNQKKFRIHSHNAAQIKIKKKESSLVSRMPSALQPYLKLMRLDRPIGTWLLYWPCSWSIALAAAPGTLPDIKMLTLFGIGAFIMRGAGCTINDMWDRDIDKQVARTKDRPLVNGSMSMQDAWIFLAGQLSGGLLILVQLNWNTIVLGASSLALVIIYPLMKRITYWPQFVLGMAFNWGALLGWTAVHSTCDLSVCVPLYLAGICWTIIYDTIYAHQDRTDDILLGIKSTAIKFGDNTNMWLGGFSCGMISCLVLSGLASQQTIPYYMGVALVGAHLTSQITKLDIHNPKLCAKTFISNYNVGLILFISILLGTLLKKNQDNSTVPNQNK